MDSEMEDRIRNRAYEIWEAEGRPEGREHDHWDQARREIMGQEASARLAPDTEAMDPTTPAEGLIAENPQAGPPA